MREQNPIIPQQQRPQQSGGILGMFGGNAMGIPMGIEKDSDKASETILKRERR
ncbi:hypothetical protein BLA29_015562, partial [Euroglyphus maynei]